MSLTAKVEHCLEELDRVFHNEDDFQIEFMQRLNQEIDGKVRPEFPFEDPLTEGLEQTYVDVLCITDETSVAIELKYPRATFHAEATPDTATDVTEKFRLRDTDAYDMAMYPFWKDVATLERLVESNAVDEAYVVQLTNFEDCWDKQKENLNGAAFYMSEGRTVSGRLAWADKASENTKEAYPAVELLGEYRMEWNPYEYSYPAHREENTEFQYLVVEAETSA